MNAWIGWSYLLTAVGILGLLLAGSKRKAGWAVGFAAQGLWVAYALATAQYGFIISAAAYGATYARNWWNWRRDEDRDVYEPTPLTPEQVKRLAQEPGHGARHMGETR